MLIALFLFLFSSGHISLVADIADPVKQHVGDKTIAKQIIEINKEMLKEDAVFGKESAKDKKQLGKINANRLASESEFADVFAALDEKRAAARSKVIDNRFKMKELMTADEWDKVHAAIN